MDIPNIFKNRTGAIQLSDLDQNFEIVRVSVNTLDQTVATLTSAQAALSAQLANFSAIPIGCIVMWAGTIATIPSGWRLCDGTNSTPDLRDKFVIGARTDSSSKAQTTVTGVNTFTGGTKDAQIVAHSHSATSSASSTVSVSSETDSWSGQIRASDSGLYANSGVFTNAGGNGDTFDDNFNSSENTENRNVNISHTYTHTHSIGVTTSVTTTVSSEGTSGTNSNLPPYYSLAFIMKIPS